jgi:hypothetical protein
VLGTSSTAVGDSGEQAVSGRGQNG